MFSFKKRNLHLKSNSSEEVNKQYLHASQEQQRKQVQDSWKRKRRRKAKGLRPDGRSHGGCQNLWIHTNLKQKAWRSWKGY